METNGKLKISMKAFGQRYIASISEDSPIDDVIPVLKGLLCAIGYHSDTVDTIFVDYDETEDPLECYDEFEPETCACEEPEDTTLQITPKEETHTVTLIYDI